MVQNLWVPNNRKTVLCVDSYECGILRGRFYGAELVAEPFESLSQFLVKMETMLEESQAPQAFTSPRTFSCVFPPEESGIRPGGIRKGAHATFEVQILFRQHTSWQGILVWQDRKLEQSFRSVLELIILIDSALRETEGREAS